MRLAITFAAAVLAAPAAYADVNSYSHATIVGPAPAVVAVVPVAPYRFHVCEARTDSLWDRKAMLERDKAAIDHEGADIARENAQVAEQMRNLDSSDTVAVAAYNVRSRALNERVDFHNRDVANLNNAVALLNADSADLTAFCDRVRYAYR